MCCNGSFPENDHHDINMILAKLAIATVPAVAIRFEAPEVGFVPEGVED